MTCPRCARDLLILAMEAQARGDTAVIAQPLREAITEWEHDGEARALTGELRRWETLGQPPNLRYWLIVAERRLAGVPLLDSAAVALDPARPCWSCPGTASE